MDIAKSITPETPRDHASLAAVAEGVDGPYNFPEYLAQRADAESADLRKGQKTRLRLLVAASRLLERHGYHGLHIHRIGEEAGMASSAVYRYFDSKESVTMEVMNAFTDRNIGLMLDVRHYKGTPYQRLLLTNVRWVSLFHHNVGLMQCAHQLSNSDAIPEFVTYYIEKNAEWHEVIASSILRHAKDPGLQFRHALVAASSAAVMVDGILHLAYILESDTYKHLRDSPEKMAEVISFFWFRHLYGRDPDEEDLSPSYPLRKLTLREEDGAPDDA